MQADTKIDEKSLVNCFTCQFHVNLDHKVENARPQNPFPPPVELGFVFCLSHDKARDFLMMSIKIYK